MFSRRLFFGLILLGLTTWIGYTAYNFIEFTMLPASTISPPKAIFYEVKKNEPTLIIASELEKAGIVRSAKAFYWYARLTGKSKKFKAGDYKFSTKMKPDEVMELIMSGVSFGFPFTVPEGQNFRQIAAILEETRSGSGEKFLKLVQDQNFIRSLGLNPPSKTLEGYLFPDTYLIGRKTPVEEIIKNMVNRTLSIFDEELINRVREIGFTEYQTLTLASVVEKETGAKEERPKIASVFHNRIKKKMKLQSDPTVIYGIPDYSGNIRKSDLLEKTPYNTYVIYGLPLGPIGNPGKDAIMATLFPVETEYLYFVSHNDGTHEFTTNYEDHKKAVAKFQLNRRAREGKSWRDLHKKQSQ